jgi:hypothetical protein
MTFAGYCIRSRQQGIPALGSPRRGIDVACSSGEEEGAPQTLLALVKHMANWQPAVMFVSENVLRTVERIGRTVGNRIGCAATFEEGRHCQSSVECVEGHAAAAAMPSREPLKIR